MNLLDRFLSIFKAGIDISGTWNGLYRYGEGYSDIVRKQVVAFNAELQQRDGYFVGKAKESANGIPEVSTIEGQLKGHKITFTKTYQHRYKINRDGEMHVDDGHLYVHYAGEYDPSLDKFSGEWTIEVTYFLFDGKRHDQTSRGTWEMKKVK